MSYSWPAGKAGKQSALSVTCPFALRAVHGGLLTVQPSFCVSSCVPSAGKPSEPTAIVCPVSPEFCNFWGTSGHKFVPPPGGGGVFECACGKFRHVAAERDLSEFSELVYA